MLSDMFAADSCGPVQFSSLRGPFDLSEKWVGLRFPAESWTCLPNGLLQGSLIHIFRPSRLNKKFEGFSGAEARQIRAIPEMMMLLMYD